MIYAACGYQLADGAKGRESAGGQWDSNGLVFGGLVGNTEGKRVLRRSSYRWENDTKMYRKEIQ